jgi:hypothetical protein
MAKYFLLAFVVVMGSATVATTASVRIYNHIGVNSPIQVHCKSRSGREVIPETTLQNGERVQWGFKPSIWGSTDFYCVFQWGALRYQAFDVWVDAFLDFFQDQRVCNDCVWYVTQDGFREYKGDEILGTATGSPVARYAWNIGT